MGDMTLSKASALNPDAATLEYLREHLGKANPFEVDDRLLFDRPLHNAPDPSDQPLPQSLTLSTLESLAGYWLSGVDSFGYGETIFHVRGPREVGLVGKLEGFRRQRPELAVARCDSRVAGVINTQLSHESAVLALQSRFRDCGFRDLTPEESAEEGVDGGVRAICDRAKLLTAIAAVRAEDFEISADDGVNQTVSSQKGSITAGWSKADNPAMLSPYSSFPGIDLPPSPFYVRFRKGDDGSPRICLVPSDGGAWKLEAVRMIGEKLAELLGDHQESTVRENGAPLAVATIIW